MPSNKQKNERIRVKFSRRKDCQMYLTRRKNWESWTWKKLVFRWAILYLWTKVCAHIIRCYGPRLNVFIPQKESVAFMCQEVLFKSKSVKIVYHCQQHMSMTSKNIFLMSIQHHLLNHYKEYGHSHLSAFFSIIKFYW